MIRGGDRMAAWDADGNLVFSQFPPEKTQRLRPRESTGVDHERILLGRLGPAQPADLTPEESVFWDRTKAEVDDLHDRGLGVEIPSEIPDIRKPEAQTNDGL